MNNKIIKFLVRLHGEYNILVKLVETPRKFIIAELSIRKLGSSSVIIIRLFEFARPFLQRVGTIEVELPRFSVPTRGGCTAVT